jgi:hypothetical protein
VTGSDGDGGTGGSVVVDSGSSEDVALVDSGAPDVSDGGVCIDIDVSKFDRTCATDTDCIDVYAGMLCDGYDCTCGGAAISADAQAAYDALFSSVHPGPGPLCSCPSFGRPRCLQNECVFCPHSSDPSAPAGCPDGG